MLLEVVTAALLVSVKGIATVEVAVVPVETVLFELELSCTFL